jgi:hypothetical protein
MNDTDLPHSYYCPITLELMKNPYIDADGFTYEFEAIKRWYATHNNSPITNLPIKHKVLTPNRALKDLIEPFLDTNNVQSPTPKNHSKYKKSKTELHGKLLEDAVKRKFKKANVPLETIAIIKEKENANDFLKYLFSTFTIGHSKFSFQLLDDCKDRNLIPRWFEKVSLEEFKKLESIFFFRSTTYYNKLLQKVSSIDKEESEVSSDFLLKMPCLLATLIVENSHKIDKVLKRLNLSLGDLLQLCVKKNEKTLCKLIEESIESKELLHKYFTESNVSDLLIIDVDLLDYLLSSDFFIPPDITFSLQEIVDLYTNKKTSFDFLFKKGLIIQISTMIESDNVELKRLIQLPEPLLSGHLEKLHLLRDILIYIELDYKEVLRASYKNQKWLIENLSVLNKIYQENVLLRSEFIKINTTKHYSADSIIENIKLQLEQELIAKDSPSKLVENSEDNSDHQDDQYSTQFKRNKLDENNLTLLNGMADHQSVTESDVNDDTITCTPLTPTEETDGTVDSNKTKAVLINCQYFSWFLLGISPICMGLGSYQYFNKSNFFKFYHPYDWISLLAISFIFLTVYSLLNRNKSNHSNCLLTYSLTMIGFITCISSGIAFYFKNNAATFALLLFSSALLLFGKASEFILKKQCSSSVTNASVQSMLASPVSIDKRVSPI